MSVDASLIPLLREINDLKRVRAAGIDGTLAARAFRRSWGRLVAGNSPSPWRCGKRRWPWPRPGWAASTEPC